MGARGYNRNYGGWETLVKNLIDNWNDSDTQFYVFEVSNSKERTVFYPNGIIAPQIKCPRFGNATMVYFSIVALMSAMNMVRKNKIENPIFYVLGVRIGTVFKVYRRKLRKMGIKIMINPDGLEWKRAKWNSLIKMYFRLSEKHMIESSDAIICDSHAIKKYVQTSYPSRFNYTYYASYGSIPINNSLVIPNNNQGLLDFGLQPFKYYLIVGRFVPENNYDLIIREFMKSTTDKELIIITNHQGNPYYEQLIKSTGFNKDKRIKFIGTVYDAILLGSIRKNAFAYIHGHSAGGTNPSLLEAMTYTKLILAFKVIFNQEVLGDIDCYFDDQPGNLCELIHRFEGTEKYDQLEFETYFIDRVKKLYTWDKVVKDTQDIINTLF